MKRKPVLVRPPSHDRLRTLVGYWREMERRTQDADGRETPVSAAYRYCANDLDLVLRDDLTIQPLRHEGQ